ncbi:MAG: Type-1 restriction enzyme MjaXIP specificity protein [Candidatus Syntrophoarchaeum sp. GoM_oil]|nr:MAG: Type-1 restriction enzyme MjaXIP specificity protein [Candidatus Syntrophoarchaeum sp. GoM_oil]
MNKQKTKFKQTEIGMIPEEWEVKKIGDFLDIKHGFAFKGEFFSVNEIENILLTPGNFKIGGGFKGDKLKYTTEEPPKDYVLKEGDIIVTMTDLSKMGDTLGYSAKIPPSNNKKFLHNQRIGLLKFKSNEVNSGFIYWVLRTKQYNFFVVGSATGSTVKHTSPNRIKLFQFGMPPLPEQTSIAKILSSLDSKIELNQQMNKTLEAIAQALFKRWFVDFEFPDENGEPYKSSGGEMVDSEMGKVPKGWAIKTIGNIVTVKGGTTPSTKKQEYWDNGTIHWCTPKDLSNLGSPVLLDTERKITNKGLATISSGLLPKGTVLLSSRAPIGYLAISEVPVSINQGFIAILCDKETPNYYILNWIRFNLGIIKNMAGGSTFQEINKANFKSIRIIIPNSFALREFERIALSLFNRIVSNEIEITKLSRIRDSLLPRLMSGKIRVPFEVQK